MTFRSLALSNIKGKWRSYSAFFLSSAFSVLLFYLYAAFLNHPDVASGYIVGASKVTAGMEYCLYIIIIFSSMFILYSNSAFLKTRKQEFGLFSLFGMTKRQLRKLVFYENMVIALLSIATGIGLGVLFSKLFFMTLGAMIGMTETIAFAVPVKAVVMTAGGFFILFLFISLLTVFRIGRTEIIELLAAASKPRGKLVFSKWLVALGALSLASGYGMALVMDANSFVILALPILITVIAGTYFLFTQLSVFALRFIQGRPGLYYKKTNMLIFAQLGYKIRDNARILFTVSILSAVIMTALGAVYIMHVQTKQDLLDSVPYSIAYIEKGLHSHDVIDPDEMKNVLRRDGFEITSETKVEGMGVSDYNVVIRDEAGTERFHFGSSNERNDQLMIISASDYNKLAAQQGKKTIVVESGTAMLSIDRGVSGTGTVSGVIADDKTELSISGVIDSNVLNSWLDRNTLTLVADDMMFSSMLWQVPEEERLVFYGYDVAGWEKAVPTFDKLRAIVNDAEKGNADLYLPRRYESSVEASGLTIFIGMFISLLFFVAAGSMIYFKLFTELQEDQAQFRSLSRIGMTSKEIRRVVVSQIAVIFFLPCLVGISHAMFAMQSLDNMMMTTNWFYSFVVIGIYIVMQFLYFLLASNSYMKGMLRGSKA